VQRWHIHAFDTKQSMIFIWITHQAGLNTAQYSAHRAQRLAAMLLYLGLFETRTCVLNTWRPRTGSRRGACERSAGLP